VLFCVSLIVDGALAGAVYALVALAFVVVYKASRMINFALGEWAMLGSRLAATGLYWVGLGVAGALGFASAGMIGVALAFNRVVLRRLVGRPLISLIMVTIGFGALVRGVSPLMFRGVPATIPLPIAGDALAVGGLLVSADKLTAATVAVVAIAAATWFFRASRTGLALRAIADDQQAAMAVGIDVDHHFAITWGMVGVLSVLAGVLWILVSGSGFGIALVGLKVFPIVIIGGLDSIPGTIVGAVAIGILESLAAGYLDPRLGGGSSVVASYLALVGMLCVRPYGLYGRPRAERI
jgi:branched-chain amino acid transport system permease protein